MLKEYEDPLKEYKQCCLRTFIVKVLNEALKIDKEFKHGIGTNDVTRTCALPGLPVTRVSEV